MTRAALPLLVFAASPILAAQLPDDAAGTRARTGVVFESYGLSDGLAFSRITELVIPVSVTRAFGRRVSLDLSTAYARASVRTADGDIDIAGLVDTDVRAAVTVIPGRLVLTLVGTLPTGVETVPDTTVPLFGATATDLFGFMVPSVGSGGGVAAGFASAFPLGETWAIGTGASYRQLGKYVPVQGGGELTPGAEGRVRFGVEGPLGGGKYFRGAVTYSVNEHDEISGGDPSITGDRALIYASLNLPLGRRALSLYAWNMHRFRPRASSSTYADATQVPRGNFVVVGARLDSPASPSLAVSPSLELRHELSGGDTLRVLGYLVRPGVHLRYRIGGRAALVTGLHYAFGQLRDEGVTVWTHGPRLSLFVDWAR
ncbi:MAG TPA: hypothetical protein VGA20_07910 [Gemmatimonadales bacterium]